MILEIPLIIGSGVVICFCISTIFWECRHSRCTSIKCCGCELQRKLMTQESMKLDERPERPTMPHI